MPTLQLASLKELSVPVPDELDAEKMRDALDADAEPCLEAAIEELKRKQVDRFQRGSGASYDKAEPTGLR